MFSIVIITLNEADNIAACLEPLKRVAEDIIVVDALSEDGTADIARDLGVEVFEKEWTNYADNKNFGNEKAKNDWILSIDADEILSEDLIASLKNLIPENGQVYAFDRQSSLCGKWIRHGAWYPDWKVRLFNRKEAHWEGDFVHEVLKFPTEFEVIRVEGKLRHYSYKSRKDFFERTRKYARLAGEALFEKGEKATIIKLWGAPVFRFLRDYFWKKGLLDGKAGWTIASRSAWGVWRKYHILKKLINEKKAGKL